MLNSMLHQFLLDLVVTTSFVDVPNFFLGGMITMFYIQFKFEDLVGVILDVISAMSKKQVRIIPRNTCFYTRSELTVSAPWTSPWTRRGHRERTVNAPWLAVNTPWCTVMHRDRTVNLAVARRELTMNSPWTHRDTPWPRRGHAVGFGARRSRVDHRRI